MVNISDFFNDMFVQYAVYDSYRSVGSYVDGLKPSSRKVVYTVLKYNIVDKIKVSQLGSKVSETTQYLHGEDSIFGVISNLARSYTGSNNLNLLVPDANFGSRYVQEPGAPRYIYTRKTKYLDLIYDKRDEDLLTPQIFEGDIIEPKSYYPIIPMILINGSEGIGTGFAQRILPRNHFKIIALLKKCLSENRKPSPEECTEALAVWYNGFSGEIKQVEEKSWDIFGVIERKSPVLVEIHEIPIGYDLKGYRSVLSTLEEKKEIRKYEDLSDGIKDTFRFNVTLNREDGKLEDLEILRKLKLVSRVTENYTCISEDNEVIEFKTSMEIFSRYLEIRLGKYEERRQNLIKILKGLLEIYENKCRFIKEVVNNSITFKNKKTEELEKELLEKNYAKDNQDSFKYLLSIQVFLLTEDKIRNLEKLIEEKKKELKFLEESKPEELWILDLENLEKNLKL